MTWVRDSDDTARRAELRDAGKDAALLWFVAMRECAAADGDGLMPPRMIRDAAYLYGINHRKATVALIEQGLWHDPAALKACSGCDETSIPDGAVLIHDWREHILPESGKKDGVVRSRDQRRKALNRNVGLVTKVRERDRDLCRYCGVQTTDSSGADKRSKSGRTLDHVNPWGENTYANVVVACRRCNGIKGERDPETAGMLLLEPGSKRPENPTDRPDNGRVGQENPALAREAGPGRVGSGPRPDSGPVLAGNGAGPGQGRGVNGNGSHQ